MSSALFEQYLGCPNFRSPYEACAELSLENHVVIVPERLRGGMSSSVIVFRFSSPYLYGGRGGHAHEDSNTHSWTQSFASFASWADGGMAFFMRRDMFAICVRTRRPKW
jgi:hypothetical protein